VRQAIQKARDGEGPTYIEARTYRFRGHSISDPGTYRSDQEKKLWKDRDPIPNFAEFLVSEGHAARERIEAVQAEEKEGIEKAIAFAEESPDPDPGELWADVYVED
jgi:pyruvate dehydrogenase E1 component alpha subunit